MRLIGIAVVIVTASLATSCQAGSKASVPVTQPESSAATVAPAPTADPTTPSTIAEPPASSGSPKAFAQGDDFDATCVVAWPTAPERTSSSIAMRMSCTGVPSRYQFVDVTYGDPNLDVTPSTGSMHVRGTVQDVARSQLGFMTLVVLASDIQK